MSSNTSIIDKSHWVEDALTKNCNSCNVEFTLLERRHHCRLCGKIFCDDCCCLRAISDKTKLPDRLCQDCILTVAFAATGVSPKEPENRSEPIVVPVNEKGVFQNLSVQSSDGKPSVTGAANAHIELENCWIQGIEKGSNGHLSLKNCFISGDVAMDIHGNNKVEMRNCIVFGNHIAVKLHGNAHLEAHECYFIATGEPGGVRGTGMKIEANGKAHCHHCVISSSTGVSASANGKIVAEGGSICGQEGVVSFLSSFFSVAGKAELNGVIIVGPVAARANEQPPMAKFQGMLKSQVKRVAKRALHHVPGGHVVHHVAEKVAHEI